MYSLEGIFMIISTSALQVLRVGSLNVSSSSDQLESSLP